MLAASPAPVEAARAVQAPIGNEGVRQTNSCSWLELLVLRPEAISNPSRGAKQGINSSF